MSEECFHPNCDCAIGLQTCPKTLAAMTARAPAQMPPMFDLHDLPGMTVEQHHRLCVGMLAGLYKFAPPDMQAAIMQGLEAYRAMGAPIEPTNAMHGLALCLNQ